MTMVDPWGLEPKLLLCPKTRPETVTQGWHKDGAISCRLLTLPGTPRILVCGFEDLDPQLQRSIMLLDISHQATAQLFWREVCALVFVLKGH